MIKAEVLKHSVNERGVDVVTFLLTAPKFLDAEFEKHRMISSNASSDRAIAFEKMCAKDIFIPNDVRLNQKGMQGFEKLPALELKQFRSDVADLFTYTKDVLSKWPVVHKQHLNRYLLGFSYQTKVATMNGSYLAYFLELRNSIHADPAMQQLAEAMRVAYANSDPVLRTKKSEVALHLPFVDDNTVSEIGLVDAIKASAARCARTSYTNHGTGEVSLEADIKLCDFLKAQKHLTPFEHQLKPMGNMQWAPGVTHVDKEGLRWSGNIHGWIQYRHIGGV